MMVCYQNEMDYFNEGKEASHYLGRTTSAGPGTCTRSLLHVCGTETQTLSGETSWPTQQQHGRSWTAVLRHAVRECEDSFSEKRTKKSPIQSNKIKLVIQC